MAAKKKAAHRQARKVLRGSNIARSIKSLREDCSTKKADPIRIEDVQNVHGERRSADRYIQEEGVFDSKVEVIHRAFELAEYYCFTVCFLRNSTYALKAIVELFHGFGTVSPIHDKFCIRDSK